MAFGWCHRPTGLLALVIGWMSMAAVAQRSSRYATNRWEHRGGATSYTRGNGFKYSTRAIDTKYPGVGGSITFACGTGTTLAQSYGQNFNADSATPWIPASSGMAGSQTGRKTGGWEGCCIMKGTPKPGDGHVPAGATSVDVLPTGHPSAACSQKDKLPTPSAADRLCACLSLAVWVNNVAGTDNALCGSNASSITTMCKSIKFAFHNRVQANGVVKVQATAKKYTGYENMCALVVGWAAVGGGPLDFTFFVLWCSGICTCLEDQTWPMGSLQSAVPGPT